MVPFFIHFPEVAQAETRTAMVLNDRNIPPGEYGFLELYCDEAGCDCRRVFIHVITPKMETGKPLATINFGWESEDFYRKWMHGYEHGESIKELKGPSLAPLQIQSEHAPHLLELFKSIVKGDEAYVDRLRAHYRLFRKTIERQPEWPAESPLYSGEVKPNAPCPCGSGAKYKKCCGSRW